MSPKELVRLTQNDPRSILAHPDYRTRLHSQLPGWYVNYARGGENRNQNQIRFANDRLTRTTNSVGLTPRTGSNSVTPDHQLSRQEAKLQLRKAGKGSERSVEERGNPESDSKDLGTPRKEPKEQAEEWKWPMGEKLSERHQAQLTELLDSFRDIFAFSMKEMSTIPGVEFEIPVSDETPIFKHQYRLAQSEKEDLAQQVAERLKNGLIRPSTSQWASPITMPPKKDENGDWTQRRACGDYRGLNRVSVTDHYQIPTPEEIFDVIGDAKVFTTLDFRQGYNQIRIAEKDRCKTAFWGADGLYEWLVMPFGLKNAPAFFQKVMDQTLRAERAFCRCYIDDLIVFSRTFEEHLEHLKRVFQRLRDRGVKCHPKKMRAAVPDVGYLGHLIVPEGTAVQEKKVEAILRIPPPADVSALRAFLGTAGYYRKFVKNYSKVASPLNHLLQEEVPYDWDSDCQNAFETLKKHLTEAPILRRPNFEREFELHTDWSAQGLGAVLTQRDEAGDEYVIAYASRSCNKTERNYSSYHGECLAAVWAVSHFRYYLYGRKFTLITDHEPLEWLMTNEKLRGMHARWANILQEYDICIKHRAGSKNRDADGLSRNPLPSELDLTGARMDHVQPLESRVTRITPQALLTGETIDTRSQKVNGALDSTRTSIEGQDSTKGSCIVDGPRILATMLARPVSQQWTAKSTASSQGRPLEEVYPIHHASEHMHVSPKCSDSDPRSTCQIESHSVQRMSTGSLPTTGHVVKCNVATSRLLTPEVGADIPPSTNQLHRKETGHQYAHGGSHVPTKTIAASGKFVRQSSPQAKSGTDQSQPALGPVIKSITRVTGTNATEAASADKRNAARNSVNQHFQGTDKDGDSLGDDLGIVPIPDIWSDKDTIQYLQNNRVYPEHTSPKERDRIRRRALSYQFEGGTLLKQTIDGTIRRVPSPEARVALVTDVHRQLGHFGVKRTYSLLEPTFWWAGMHEQVARVVASCQVCDRVKASFNVKDSVLKPLPIMGLGYRWSCDLAGPFPVSKTGNQYVMVMIEHFSKWIELVPLKYNTSEETAKAFLQVCTHYGAPAEVLTDQGQEFQGEFDTLCKELLIDHRETSRDHPQADGLAERAVQTTKRAIRKYVLTNAVDTWDEWIPWIAMGYRMSKQVALGDYSPYFLLFGRNPVVGATLREMVNTTVDLDDPKLWHAVVTARAEIFRKAIPIAFSNLQAAQHRDTLWYARTRTGDWSPKVKRFEVGDLVYLRRRKVDTLDVNVGRIILRIKEILPSGVLMLQGRDGRIVKDHVENCAPCHNPTIDLTMDTTLSGYDEDWACQICKKTNRPAKMLLCDYCGEGYHMDCLDPPVIRIPKGDWFCPRCAL